MYFAALRLQGAPLPHHLVPAGHADTAGRGRGLCPQARPGAAREELRGGVLRRGRCLGGRLPCGNATRYVRSSCAYGSTARSFFALTVVLGGCCSVDDTRADAVHRAEQRVRDLDAVVGTVLWGRDCGARAGLRRAHHSGGRQRRPGGLCGRQGGAAAVHRGGPRGARRDDDVPVRQVLGVFSPPSVGDQRF